MEQIAFDISHILRRPLTSLLALINIIEKEPIISRERLDEYVGYIKSVSLELEKFTRDLNDIYQSKKKKIADHSST